MIQFGPADSESLLRTTHPEQKNLGMAAKKPTKSSADTGEAAGDTSGRNRVRIRDEYAESMARARKDHAEDDTTIVNRALREWLIREGYWPLKPREGT